MIKKKLLTGMICIMLIMMGNPVFAHEIPDLDQTGSIEITMDYDGTRVSGGELSLYRVGDIEEDDGNYRFVLSESFENSGLLLDEVSSAELAGQLAEYAQKNTDALKVAAIDEKGMAYFRDLKPGLYLIIQSVPAEGYYPADPFLVSIPMLEDGKYVYHVDASPKIELEKEENPPVPTPTPTPTPTPGEPTPEPGTPTPSIETPEPELPYTGQLLWPIPVLAGGGLLLIIIGWMIRRKENDA